MPLMELEKGRVVVDEVVVGTRHPRRPRWRRKDPDGRTMTASIKRAAELQALADELRQRRVKGDETVSPDEIVRVERLASACCIRSTATTSALTTPDVLVVAGDSRRFNPCNDSARQRVKVVRVDAADDHVASARHGVRQIVVTAETMINAVLAGA
jgi:hypothetical protein